MVARILVRFLGLSSAMGRRGMMVFVSESWFGVLTPLESLKVGGE
jgi:hypothetical protein